MAPEGPSSPLVVTRGSAAPSAPSVASPRAAVRVRGEHDLATRSELSASLAHEIDREVGDLVVDLSLVEFMDASTVGVLVGARNLLLERSEHLVVRAPSSRARRLLDLCDLAGLIEPDEAPEGPTSALGTWVEVPAMDRDDVGPAPRPAPSG